MKLKIKNKTIKEIYQARSKNNLNWMRLLDVSMQYAPDKTRKILKNINNIDLKISKLLKKISK